MEEKLNQLLTDDRIYIPHYVDRFNNYNDSYFYTTGKSHQEKLDTICKFLLDHNDNPNCLYYLAELVHYYSMGFPYEKCQEYYRQAAALGQKAAIYKIAADERNYDKIIELIYNGYDLPIDFGDKMNNIDLYEALTKYSSKKIKELEQKIMELEHRPPEIGGPSYEAAKAHFETLSS